jgi:hypothetical protein
MSCSKCKSKEEKQKIMEEVTRMEKYSLLFLIGIIALAVYGVISLVSKFL